MSKRSGRTAKKKKSSKGAIFFRTKGKQKQYPCPNCDAGKPSIRGKCPYCGYTGYSNK